MKSASPAGRTIDPEAAALIDELLASVRDVLGDHFIGMYLDGSLAAGGFDQDSDIDFVAVTSQEVSGDLFAALQTMHDRLAAGDSVWAIQLEGSYISAQALRCHDPALTMHPNIERGRGERLKMVSHDATWDIHRHVLREQGIVLAGPDPKTLVDFVGPDQLRRAALLILNEWIARILDDPTRIRRRGYQSYIVLSLCRILYTLRCSAIASKPVAARWAQEHLEENWAALIERAWMGRHDPGSAASPEDVNATLDFIRYALQQSGVA